MKGFIEVQYYGANVLTMINVNFITHFGDGFISCVGRENGIRVKESYEQIKQLIKEAQ